MAKHASEGFLTRASVMHGIDVLAAELGHNVAPTLERFGLSTDLLKTPDTPIPYLAWCQVLEACANEWNCPDFGLQLGSLQNLNILGPVGLVVRLTETVEEALRELETSLPIHSLAYAAYLDTGETNEGVAPALVYSPKVSSGSGQQMAEFGMTVMRNVLAMVAGGSQPKLKGVGFRHVAPKDRSSAQKLFCCPISYGQPRNALSFDAALLQRPTSIKDLALAPIVRDYLKRAQVHANFDVVELTSTVIGKLLHHRRCQIEDVAECLHLSPRTLQRRLSDKGVSFTTLFDNERRQLALELVAKQAMPLAHVAAYLGFSDQSSFNQAFRRWTGLTPTAFRKEKST